MTVPDLEDRATALLLNAETVAEQRDISVDDVLEGWHEDFKQRSGDYPDELAICNRSMELRREQS